MSLQSFVREPLVHFVLLGGLVFAADHAIRATRPDRRVIVVGPEVDSEARAIFHSSKGREPTPDELRVLRERWIDNEVLYREGLALRLEQGDPTLRERVIFKALNVIESNLRLPNIEDAELRSWFEAHRDQYDTPARFDFSEALPEDTKPETIRQFARALNAGEQLDVQSGLRIFQARPRSTIVDAFGEEFARELDGAALRVWHILPSKDGSRVVRLEDRTQAVAVSFDEVRQRVLLDFRDHKAQELRTAAVRELAKKYTLQFAGGSS